jgi:hypothetical protein
VIKRIIIEGEVEREGARERECGELLLGLGNLF